MVACYIDSMNNQGAWQWPPAPLTLNKKLRRRAPYIRDRTIRPRTIHPNWFPEG